LNEHLFKLIMSLFLFKKIFFEMLNLKYIKVEYIERDDADEEFDEFGRKKRRSKKDASSSNAMVNFFVIYR